MSMEKDNPNLLLVRLTPVEHKLLNTVRNLKFGTIMIYQKDNKVTRIEVTESILM